MSPSLRSRNLRSLSISCPTPHVRMLSNICVKSTTPILAQKDEARRLLQQDSKQRSSSHQRQPRPCNASDRGSICARNRDTGPSARGSHSNRADNAERTRHRHTRGDHCVVTRRRTARSHDRHRHVGAIIFGAWLRRHDIRRRCVDR
jgi:hypothetical protein